MDDSVMAASRQVDVVIQIYGKPWQSLCTLFSLVHHSRAWIDTIYILEEPRHPFGDHIGGFLRRIKRLGIPVIHQRHTTACPSEETPIGASRDSIRYQWAIDRSDKRHLFITHNDVFYAADVIGDMLFLIGESVAIGEIGQCWNCPAFTLCGGGQHWNNWNPVIDDILALPLPSLRTKLSDINVHHPKLMPECRVNEWAILINREVCVQEGEPHFGYFKLDTGTEWFRAMYKRGYTFKHYFYGFQHGYFSRHPGHKTQITKLLYRLSEQRARTYYYLHYTFLSPFTALVARCRRFLRTLYRSCFKSQS